MEKEDKEEQITEEAPVEEETAETEEASKEETAEEIEELLAEEEPAEEEEAKPRRRKKEEEEEEFVEERIYTIPLGKAWVRPSKKRTPRAMQLIRDFITKHMKMDMRAEVEEEKGEMPRLVITNEVNEKVWSRSIGKPPRKIRVRAAKDNEGNVTVYLAEGE
ncbi:50S ribosomal protein L31e [Candidatus Bathyarchaeota archaeon]|nr:50S ribosomal protein L31e [Candidatus Bathyarchaeota archaeon]